MSKRDLDCSSSDSSPSDTEGAQAAQDTDDDNDDSNSVESLSLHQLFQVFLHLQDFRGCRVLRKNWPSSSENLILES